VRIVFFAVAFLATLAAGFVIGYAVGLRGSETASATSPRTVTVERTVEKTLTAQPTASPTTSPTASASVAPRQAEMECQIGRGCDLGTSTVTVTSGRKVGTLTSNLYPPMPGHFVVVDFTYTWEGNAPTDLGEMPWVVRDGQGRSYTYNFDATNEYTPNNRDLVYAEVMPSIPKHGRVIFQVAPDAQDFTLIIVDLAKPQGSEAAEVEL
jgi:hypothetical protein